ncbi:hypothetical protein FVE85_5339 [Porphyridium purpureum]|uniref:Prefoldin subunit 1 n=1 Tax=Porphyridium purpureum TaxID=35688 RepID=A0A5J4Z494_PORPP|nr:hypothetical protein FVE85_5339 [Porphyridium purpureum]|eukprot:POR1938..scf295_1
MASAQGLQPDRAQMEQLMELQTRAMEMRQHVTRLANQIANLERDQAVARITINHIQSLPPGTQTYRPLGKCFTLDSPEALKDRLSSATQKQALEIQSKTTLREQFFVKLKENERQLEDLMDTIERGAGK